MNLSVEQVEGQPTITVLSVNGDLDASNYQQVINKVHELYQSGTRHLLLDMSNMPFMGSSGLVALHSIALLLQGEQPPDPEAGWSAFRAIHQDESIRRHQNIKLLNPQPQVERTLQMTGLKEFFDIHADRATALASFKA